MSVKSRLRTVLCCFVLEFGALVGVPMRPDEIRELMDTLNRPKLAQTNPDHTHPADGPGEAHGDVTIRRGWTLRALLPGRFAAPRLPRHRRLD